jgi:adenine phosphoribosyltransferase
VTFKEETLGLLEPFMELSEIKSLLKDFPDFPIPGIIFKDIFPLFKNPLAIETIIDNFERQLLDLKVDCIVGLDARGFLFGPLLAHRLKVPFVPVRKKGKLPGKVVEFSYEKEYGVDVLSMQIDAFNRNSQIVVIDDLLATGGSAKAAQELIRKFDGNIVKFLFLIELIDLNGKSHLNSEIYSLFQF